MKISCFGGCPFLSRLAGRKLMIIYLFIIIIFITIGLSHSVVMLSLRRIKSFVFACQASPTHEFSARLGGQNKAFYSAETRHDCRVRKVYWSVWLVNSKKHGTCSYWLTVIFLLLSSSSWKC